MGIGSSCRVLGWVGGLVLGLAWRLGFGVGFAWFWGWFRSLVLGLFWRLGSAVCLAAGRAAVLADCFWDLF